ncbi:hypothetical protein D0S45_17490 [Marinifilum sp. JC120]|nr:hypothetical protein D0S45_17490 [Marinifilum sp. JC120]
MEKKKYRKISTHIWNDERFRELSNDAKFIFLFILTHPTTTSLGALRGNVPGLAFELSMELKAFEEAFQEVLDKGMAEYDPKAGFLWFPNFLKHNSPESPNVVKGWAAGFKSLPECTLKTELLFNTKSLICCLSEGFQKAFEKAFGEPCEKAIANQGAGSREQGAGIKAEENTSPGGDVGAPADEKNDSSPANEKPTEPEQQPEAAQEDKTEKVEGPKIPNCPHAEIAEAYNRILPMLPQVKDLTPKRKSTLKAAWRNNKARQSVEWWEKYFKLVLQCPFLLGQKKDWKAGFDWLLKPGNMVKVLEGNFREEPQPPTPNQPNVGPGNGAAPSYQGMKINTVSQGMAAENDAIARQMLADGEGDGDGSFVAVTTG